MSLKDLLDIAAALITIGSFAIFAITSLKRLDSRSHQLTNLQHPTSNERSGATDTTSYRPQMTTGYTSQTNGRSYVFLGITAGLVASAVILYVSSTFPPVSQAVQFIDVAIDASAFLLPTLGLALLAGLRTGIMRIGVLAGWNASLATWAVIVASWVQPAWFDNGAGTIVLAFLYLAGVALLGSLPFLLLSTIGSWVGRKFAH